MNSVVTLGILGGPYVVQGIELGSTMYKARPYLQYYLWLPNPEF